MIGAPAEPSQGPAAGGTRVTVPGLGINPNSSYMCVFQKDVLALHVAASHLLNSNSDIVCDTPTGNASWQARFGSLGFLSDEAIFFSPQLEATTTSEIQNTTTSLTISDSPPDGSYVLKIQE